LSTPQTRLTLSCALGVFLGLTAGYLLGRLDLFPLLWAVPIGGCVGLLGVLAVLGIHWRLRQSPKR
jgi:hypothetical protein